MTYSQRLTGEAVLCRADSEVALLLSEVLPVLAADLRLFGNTNISDHLLGANLTKQLPM
ncbi:hypothetical protein ACP70R_014624 [Stipagrostis hirtigluma subsp. patula]